MKIKTAAEMMEATLVKASAALFDKEINDFSIDSRTTHPGDLFFALSPADYTRAGFNGTFDDAHRFIPQAFARGAIAAVARGERVAGDETLAPFHDRLLLVEDAIAALQKLAHRVYQAWARPVIGITGSAGKTTTKELTAHVLAASGRRVLKSERNYNNGLGLPLSVLQMVSAGRKPENFDIAVLEMGMSSPTGEIKRLCHITPPDIGVELNVAPVHLEFFGTVENIARYKRELIEGLKPTGTAVLNADDEHVIAMSASHKGHVVTFGIENQADVMATDIETTEFGLIRFKLRTLHEVIPAQLRLTGKHNLMNALAASAVATCLDISVREIAGALESTVPPHMRGEILRFTDGFTVIDDSYNSNPRSLLSMVRTLVEGGNTGARRILVAGEMLELGIDGPRLHREVGREIARCGVNILWGVRGLAAEMIDGAREAGMSKERTRFFADSDQAAAALVAEVRDGDLVLVKGSRGVRTDKVIEGLRASFQLTRTGKGE